MSTKTYGVNFINVKCTNFSYERKFRQLLLLHATRKAAKMTFVRKTRAFYIDEIDTWTNVSRGTNVNMEQTIAIV
jgi:hypothetical protein